MAIKVWLQVEKLQSLIFIAYGNQFINIDELKGSISVQDYFYLH